MLASHPVIHPMEVEGAAADLPPGVRRNDLPGMPGTPGDLGLRVTQILLAAISFAVLSTTNFASVNAFWCLFATAVFQSVWSLLVVITDIYVMLVNRSLRKRRFLAVLAFGDGIAWVITFIGASGAAGITYMMRIDLKTLEFAVATAFIDWFSLSLSFILNLYLFASARV